MSLSYSAISTFQACPERYRLQYVEKLEKREEGQEELARNWGSAIHAALARLYKGEGMSAAREAFCAECPSEISQEESVRTRENGLLLLEQYAHRYQGDPGWKVLEVEVKERFELNGVEFTVQLDLVAESLQGAGIFLWDHKTTERAFSPTYWSKFEMDEQISAYSYWIKRKYGECGGGLINGIQVGHRKRMYKGEPAGFYSKFERQIFSRSPQQLKQWEQNVGVWAGKIEQAGQTGVYGLVPGALCSYCSFRELCMSGGDQQVKDVLYRVKEVR